MVYLFLGQDSLSKDIQLRQIKEQSLAKNVEQFNLDTIYARELDLKGLQEKFLLLPVNNPKRMIVIKDAQLLKDECRRFIIDYAKDPDNRLDLVLDVDKYELRDGFINELSRYAKTVRFREEPKVDAFVLSRAIEMNKPDQALRLLAQLLRDGERPERILGGLRFAWERSVNYPQEAKRRLKLLLACDIDIKTGKLKPDFALEKLVIGLCGAGKPLH